MKDVLPASRGFCGTEKRSLSHTGRGDRECYRTAALLSQCLYCNRTTLPRAGNQRSGERQSQRHDTANTALWQTSPLTSTKRMQSTRFIRSTHVSLCQAVTEEDVCSAVEVPTLRYTRRGAPNTQTDSVLVHYETGCTLRAGFCVEKPPPSHIVPVLKTPEEGAHLR